MVALAVITLIVLAAVFAPWISPQNPFAIGTLDIFDSKLPPGSSSADGSITYWLGTDGQARDLLDELGARPRPAAGGGRRLGAHGVEVYAVAQGSQGRRVEVLPPDRRVPAPGVDHVLVAVLLVAERGAPEAGRGVEVVAAAVDDEAGEAAAMGHGVLRK